MGKILNLSLVAALAAALILTGACANISDDRTRTQTEGTLAGAGIGALLGAGIGAAIGGKRGALTGALIGAGVGAAGGYAVGTSVANKKADYASEEEWLAACLAETKQVNQQTAAYNSRLKTTLAGYRKDAGTDQQAAVKRDLKESQEVLAYLDDEITSQRKVVASTGSGTAQGKELQKQITEMEKQKKLLEQQNKELAAISNRMAI